MGRPARRDLVGDDTTNHCTWRAHNASFVLHSVEEKEKFLSLIAEHKDKHGILIHSYCIMGTHPHVQTRSTKGQAAFSKFWKVVNYRFARWYNARNGRRGQVVMDRVHSPPITDGAHQLTIMRYGDLNPVRAGCVTSPARWRWSSYRHYAFGVHDPLITDAPEYLALGKTAAQRRRAYVHLFAAKLIAPLLQRRRDLVCATLVADHDEPGSPAAFGPKPPS